MTKSNPQLYVNQFSGDIKYLRKSEAKKLSEDWSKAELITNEAGERGMRIKLDGATVDILENKDVKVASDGESVSD